MLPIATLFYSINGILEIFRHESDYFKLFKFLILIISFKNWFEISHFGAAN
jgi:hypothetical protein